LMIFPVMVSFPLLVPASQMFDGRSDPGLHISPNQFACSSI
jgi:hypothetical protein